MSARDLASPQSGDPARPTQRAALAVAATLCVASLALLLWPAGSFEALDDGPALHRDSLTALPGGDALLLQGDLQPGTARGAIFSAETRAWTPIAAPKGLSHHHTATHLAGDRVLVVEGVEQVHAWLLDTTRGQATRLPNPPSPHGPRHTATRLQDGRVLIAGGIDGTRDDLVAQAELSIFDPATNAWSAAGVMSSPRYAHTATLLEDGSVFIVGGIEPGNVQLPPRADRFDPGTGKVEHLPGPSWPRAGHQAAALPDGTVLICGGAEALNSAEAPLRLAEVFDLEKGAWRDVGAMRHGRRDFAAVTLADGRVLVVGGWWRDDNRSFGGYGHQVYSIRERLLGIPKRSQLDRTEVFDPDWGRWAAGPRLQLKREEPRAVRAGGGVLVHGDGAWPEWASF